MAILQTTMCCALLCLAMLQVTIDCRLSALICTAILQTTICCALCPVTWIPHRVKGHQDDDQTALVDRWALLNIEMNNRAKLHWADTVDQPRELQRTISGEPWAFWVKDTKICMNLHASIATATRGQASLNYWEQHGKYRQGTHSDIDWQATGQTMAKVKITRRHWVSKHSPGFCGTSKMMHI
jgi:hypothetical protein